MELSEINDATSKYRIHQYKGYIKEMQQLTISKETIQRANACGFNISDFAECCLKAINTSCADNGYDDIAKIVECFAAVAILFLKKYRVKDVEVAHFLSNDTQEEFTIYLSEMQGSYIMVGKDDNGEPSVRVTNANEIWRYLAEPCHIIDATISTIIAYAEKHQSIKDEWILTLESIEEISKLTS